MLNSFQQSLQDFKNDRNLPNSVDNQFNTGRPDKSSPTSTGRGPKKEVVTVTGRGKKQENRDKVGLVYVSTGRGEKEITGRGEKKVTGRGESDITGRGKRALVETLEMHLN